MTHLDSLIAPVQGDQDPMAPTARWRQGLADGQLIYQHCDACRSAVYYPRVVCPLCGASELKFMVSSGRGTVYATTAVYSRTDIYNGAIIEAEEGFTLMSSVRDIDPEEVEIGMRVELSFSEEEAGPLPVFRPSSRGRKTLGDAS